jgi:hypothetical protein
MALTAGQMVEAIRTARGFVSKAADLCGVSRRTFYRYLEQFSSVQEALEDEREKRHDFVENKLMHAIDGDNITAIIFYLKTQCKARGYVERVETTGKDGGPVIFRVVYDEETGS